MTQFDPQTGAPVIPQYAAPMRPAETSGGATMAGIVGLIAAILGFVVPFHGWAYFALAASGLAIVALNGGAKALGITIVVLNMLNLAISPSDPLSVWALYLKIYGNTAYPFPMWVFGLAALNWVAVVFGLVLTTKKRRY